MLFGVLEGSSLELRAVDGRRVISGRFPYNKWAVTSDRGKNGRPRKNASRRERFSTGHQAIADSTDNCRPSLMLVVVVNEAPRRRSP